MMLGSSRLPLLIAALSLTLAVGAYGADCNQNGVEDAEDLVRGTSDDCDLDGLPDECTRPPVAQIFGESVPLPLPRGGWRDLRPTDVENDGDLDLVTIVTGSLDEPDHVVVVSNHGDGTFTSSSVFTTSAYLDDVIRGDIDLDGDEDLVAVLWETGTTEADVHGFLPLYNDGAGAFAAGVEHPSLTKRAFSPLLADLDGDGDIDLAYNDYGSYPSNAENVVGRTVEVKLNRGNGTFLPPMAFPAGDSPYRLVATDTDGDGDVDLVASNTGDRRTEATVDTLSVLVNVGDATFEEPVTIPLGYPATVLLAADLDQDGDTDLFTASNVNGEVSVLRNRGDGSFEAPGHFPTGHAQGASQVVLFDADDDGDADVLASRWSHTGNFVSILTNDGNGAFPDRQYFDYGEDQHAIRAAPADVDGDGDRDLVVALYDSNNRIAVHVNDGSGSVGAFSEPHLLGVGPDADVRGIVPADFDDDGDIDLIAGRVFLRHGGLRSQRGCRQFLRGDVNADGAVSASDMLALRRWLFIGSDDLICRDAADFDDDETFGPSDIIAFFDAVFLTPNWPTLLPEPALEAGRDPTYAPDDPDDVSVGCAEYSVTPAAESTDHLSIGSVVASPGEEIELPVYLTNTVAVEAFQLVVTYDPDLLVVVSTREDAPSPLSFAGTFFETIDNGTPALQALTAHPEAGVITLVVVGSVTDDGGDIPPGADRPVARIRAHVSETAPIDTEVVLEAPESGVGPYALRNELTVRGEARFVSTLPVVERGRVAIVGDQAFFRGDSNQDEKVDLSDAVHTLSFLFLGGFTLACEDAADADDNGALDLTDAVFTLNHLFLTGAPIPPPSSARGLDPTHDQLRCRR